MSQHDYNIADQSGSSFLTDINNALAAIVSQNSGATEPATMFAYQWWADTTTGKLKLRNAANSAWIEIGTLATTNLGLALVAGVSTQTFSVADATAIAHAVRADQIQKQSLTAYTTGGTSTAYTITTLGTPIALTTGERWRIKFDQTAGATPTLNRDAKGAKSLKLYDSAGAKVAASATTIIANMLTDVEYDGTDYVILDPLPSAITAEPYIYIREEQVSGTHGGTATASAWTKRTLNTEVYDASGLASIASSVITLAAGTYRFKASAPFMGTYITRLKLKNTSDAIDYVGSNRYVGANDSHDATCVGRFTIASSKNFELQYYATNAAATYGLGYASSIGTEVYAEIEFWKEV